MKHFIYVITQRSTNMHYVGMTANPSRRWTLHKDQANPARKRRLAVSQAIHEHGVGDFTFDVIESWDTKAEALEAELFWIDFFQTENASMGFNRSPKTKVWTETHKANISKAKKGKTFSDEHKTALSAAQAGKPRPWRVGVKMSDEARAKMSAAAKRRYATV